MPTKRTRCTCKRCGKVNYLPSAGIDPSEPFLCEACDSKFIAWCNTVGMVGGNERNILACFLLRNPCKQR